MVTCQVDEPSIWGRAIRDALTAAELPERPGLELDAAFVPAAEQVSGDFYLVAEGPREDPGGATPR
jgi:serine phosphatase RsbU (regulator of sigma subunit)